MPKYTASYNSSPDRLELSLDSPLRVDFLFDEPDHARIFNAIWHASCPNILRPITLFSPTLESSSDSPARDRFYIRRARSCSNPRARELPEGTASHNFLFPRVWNHHGTLLRATDFISDEPDHARTLNARWHASCPNIPRLMSFLDCLDLELSADTSP